MGCAVRRRKGGARSSRAQKRTRQGLVLLRIPHHHHLRRPRAVRRPESPGQSFSCASSAKTCWSCSKRCAEGRPCASALISPCAAEGSALPPRSARLVARRQEEGEATELRLSALSPRAGSCPQ